MNMPQRLILLIESKCAKMRARARAHSNEIIMLKPHYLRIMCTRDGKVEGGERPRQNVNTKERCYRHYSSLSRS